MRQTSALLHACLSQPGMYAYRMRMIHVSDDDMVLPAGESFCAIKVGIVNEGGNATLGSRIQCEVLELKARLPPTGEAPRLCLGTHTGAHPPLGADADRSDHLFLSVGPGMASRGAEAEVRNLFLPLGSAMSSTNWTSALYPADLSPSPSPGRSRSYVGLTELVLTTDKVASLTQRAFHRHGAAYDPRLDTASHAAMHAITRESFTVTLTFPDGGQQRVLVRTGKGTEGKGARTAKPRRSLTFV